jgi:hypothetical protein
MKAGGAVSQRKELAELRTSSQTIRVNITPSDKTTQTLIAFL